MKFRVNPIGIAQIIVQLVIFFVVLVGLVLAITFKATLGSAPIDIIDIVTTACPAAAILIATIVTMTRSLINDFVFLESEGISYRRGSKEMLFLSYDASQAERGTLGFLGFRRNGREREVIVIGHKGALPESTQGLKKFCSFADGWFTCSYSDALADALFERSILPDRPDRPTPPTQPPKRPRKQDDTHDSDPSTPSSGWHIE